jgi:hypothetical protein
MCLLLLMTDPEKPLGIADIYASMSAVAHAYKIPRVASKGYKGVLSKHEAIITAVSFHQV